MSASGAGRLRGLAWVIMGLGVVVLGGGVATNVKLKFEDRLDPDYAAAEDLEMGALSATAAGVGLVVLLGGTAAMAAIGRNGGGA